MKALLISIHTEHALDILKGDKKLELRKSVPKGFVGWVYGYVTKGKPYITMQSKTQFTLRNDNGYTNVINATIPFRFWFEEYEKLNVSYSSWVYAPKKNEKIIKNLCLTDEQIEKYSWSNGAYKDLYAWHIKKLEIFDKPMELGNLYTWNESYEQCPFAMNLAEEYMTTEEILVNRGSKTVTRPPQSYQYVWAKGESNE